MEIISQNLLWESLLDLKNKVSISDSLTHTYSIVFSKGVCWVTQGIEHSSKEQKSIIISNDSSIEATSGNVLFRLDTNNILWQEGECFLDISTTNFLIQYLPFCFCSDFARKHNRSYTVLHLAQSIDGRIATESGHSRWVSNQENLIHSHRMRALCDAILIGKNTLQCDLPMLTVRHVSGSNPIRVILANSSCNFDNLKKYNGKILLFTAKEIPPIEGVEIIYIPDISGYILTEQILKELYQRNIFSLYIEGGAITASHFIHERSVDKVQIFISPKIFGSGLNSFNLPPIEKVEKSIGFSNSSFIPMGNGMLFEGIVDYTRDSE